MAQELARAVPVAYLRPCRTLSFSPSTPLTAGGASRQADDASVPTQASHATVPSRLLLRVGRVPRILEAGCMHAG